MPRTPRSNCAIPTVSPVCGEFTARAWSLTSPYGAGKSAFALFVARLLGGSGDVRRRARRLLKAADRGAAERLFSAGSALARNGAFKAYKSLAVLALRHLPE